ncbi:hypothetical protein N7454_000843 [Penicillium verhagenii]|nr:hypothetical protein N7454_000843 [Penicillium verhagenii]
MEDTHDIPDAVSYEEDSYNPDTWLPIPAPDSTNLPHVFEPPVSTADNPTEPVHADADQQNDSGEEDSYCPDSWIPFPVTDSPAAPGKSVPSPENSPVEQMQTDEADSSIRSDKDASIWLPLGVLDRDFAQDNTMGPAIALLREHDRVYQEGADKIFINTNVTGRRHTQKNVKNLRNAVKLVMARIDRSLEAWVGQCSAKRQDLSTSNGAEDDSLWYIFNTLDNPNPDVEAIRDPWAQMAMDDLLSGDNSLAYDIKTPLYPYQRRSAAAMIQREAQPKQMLDPRLQACQTPTGVEYYYDKEDGIIVREKTMYSEACGGILAETMGCGKTLICLAVICATRGHVPKIPIEYLSSSDPRPVRKKVGSLMEMAAAAIGRHSVPWRRVILEKRKQGMFYENCIRACERDCGSYEFPSHQARYPGRQTPTSEENRRSAQKPPGKRIRTCSGTIIIVPTNLVDHWQHEIEKHTEGLKVLILRSSSDKIPPADELLDYDIVLFAKTRFAGEPIETYLPLTELHWLRVIVDEGHNVAGNGTKTNMMCFIHGLQFERRWVISGTPSTGLYGVEISLASLEANTSDTEPSETMTASALKTRKKTGNAIDNEMKDLDKIRRIVIEFLDLKPWSNSRANDPVDWTKYIKPLGQDGKRRKTPAIRATLQGLVVRHQLDVVSKEITLPKLYNKVVYLKPTYYDRLSINLFLFGLAVNSITSERQGSDYMFDSKNRKSLNLTITNLRQAGFWWVGFDKDLAKTVDVALEYLEKKKDTMLLQDILRLTEGIGIARQALGSTVWHELQQLHELGVLVQDFPQDNRAYWAFDPQTEENPILMGITQARLAQKFITKQLRLADPTQGLSGHGITVRRDIKRTQQRASAKGATESNNNLTAPSNSTAGSSPAPTTTPTPKSTSPRKKTFHRNIFQTLSEDSGLKRTKFVATSSAKLTYLLDQVLKHQEREKIIIFYDSINSAFWIAEGLELLGVDFRIYASNLNSKSRTEYLHLFRETNDVRVLLMDLRQASHGLHIAQASRVYIVNPIWQPNVESQAIKRAHRIGQTRPVYVETLVLEDTLEDKMLRRRKEMSQAEMQQAEKNLLDDNAMNELIQNEPFLEMSEKHCSSAAFLVQPTGFFDRHRLPIPDNEVDGPATSRKRSHAAIAESDADSDAFTLPGNGHTPTPTPKKSRKTKPKKARVGFAPDVGGENGGSSGSSSSQPPLPPPLVLPNCGKPPRPKSLFGPF